MVLDKLFCQSPSEFLTPTVSGPLCSTAYRKLLGRPVCLISDRWSKANFSISAITSNCLLSKPLILFSFPVLRNELHDINPCNTLVKHPKPWAGFINTHITYRMGDGLWLCMLFTHKGLVTFGILTDDDVCQQLRYVPAFICEIFSFEFWMCLCR